LSVRTAVAAGGNAPEADFSHATGRLKPPLPLGPLRAINAVFEKVEVTLLVTILLGMVALAYMWCRMVEAAQAKLASGSGAPERWRAKLTTARFFMERVLPETGAQLARIQSGAGSTMELPAEGF